MSGPDQDGDREGMSPAAETETGLMPRAWAGALAPVLALLVALGAWTPGASADDRFRSDDNGYPYSLYPEVAEDVLRLGLEPDSGRNIDCEHNYFSANPCFESIPLWREFADRHGLERDWNSAHIFQYYIRRDYRRADKLFAVAKGYELPPHGGYEGPGLEVLAFKLQPDSNQKHGCENNPYSANPCREATAAWEAFAKKHELPLDPRGAAIFQAYVNGDFVKGDRLYAALTGEHTHYEVVHSGIANEILSLNMGMETGERGGCDINPFDYNPCLGAARVLREFAKKHGLKANRKTAKLMAAYAEGEFEDGDELYASAKGITVDELLDQHNVPRKPKEREVPRLIIDIRAGLAPPPWRAPGPCGVCG